MHHSRRRLREKLPSQTLTVIRILLRQHNAKRRKCNVDACLEASFDPRLKQRMNVDDAVGLAAVWTRPRAEIHLVEIRAACSCGLIRFDGNEAGLWGLPGGPPAKIDVDEDVVCGVFCHGGVDACAGMLMRVAEYLV